MKKKIIIVLLSVFTGQYLMAQQDPLFTQYAFNQVALNPAVAGTHNGMSFTAMSRLQWSDFEGAPETHIFSGHAPLRSENMGIGFTFFNDQVGVSRQNELGLLYSYKLRFENSTLSFGLRAAFTSFKATYTDVNLGGIQDPRFQGNDFTDLGVNFGAGLYYYSDKYYIGLSTPHLTVNRFRGDNNSDIAFVRDRVYYLLGGYVFDLSPNFKLKPYTNIRVPSGAPVQMDVNASLIYKDEVYLGFGVRPNTSVSVLFEWQIDNFRLGYAADIINNDSNAFGRSASEFLLNYTLFKKNNSNPSFTPTHYRYF